MFLGLKVFKNHIFVVVINVVKLVFADLHTQHSQNIDHVEVWVANCSGFGVSSSASNSVERAFTRVWSLKHRVIIVTCVERLG